jgi:hypothetical protein
LGIQRLHKGQGLRFENCRSGIAVVHGFLLLLTDCSACCLTVCRWIGEMEQCWGSSLALFLLCLQ